MICDCEIFEITSHLHFLKSEITNSKSEIVFGSLAQLVQSAALTEQRSLVRAQYDPHFSLSNFLILSLEKKIINPAHHFIFIAFAQWQ